VWSTATPLLLVHPAHIPYYTTSSMIIHSISIPSNNITTTIKYYDKLNSSYVRTTYYVLPPHFIIDIDSYSILVYWLVLAIIVRSKIKFIVRNS